MRQRLVYLLKVYLTTLLVFVLAKIVFMLLNHEGHDFAASDVWDVLRHGLSLDLSTSLYLLILPFLVSAISIWWDGKLPQLILRVYYAIIAIAMILAFVADTSLYPFWGFKLDASCLQYLDTPTEAGASVSTGYLIVRFCVLIAGAVLLYFIYSWIPFWKKKSTHRITATLIHILLIPLLIIGIRGGLDESTTNIGQVYYSQNQFLNHSAVNPVFSFLASLEKTASQNMRYEFMSDAECEKITSELFTTESLDVDTLLNTTTPNIILILMEGCGGQFTELSGRTDITPNLNRLAHEGVYFTNCYGNSWRTDRGTLCTLSGYPSFPTISVMKMPSKTRTLPCLARSLHEAKGYSTHYLYGGDINFTNMRSYLIGGGFEQLTWKADYTTAEQKTAEWGVRDDITFNTLFSLATSQPQPYLIGYSTLSSHEPWDVPIHQFDDEILNAFYYLDQCIGDFITRLRQSEAWQNTLVIMLPDHGIQYKEYDELHPLRNHIPMIWVGGAVKAPRRIETICNQTDLPATLLGQLGLPHADYTYSRDVLSSSYTHPLAIHTFTEGFSLVDSTGYTVFDLNTMQTIKGHGDVNLGKAILQSASKDLQQRK